MKLERLRNGFYKKASKLFLSVVMLLTVVPTSLSSIVKAADDNKGLVNIAAQSAISVPSEEKPASNMIDGDPTTLWTSGDGKWPATINITLPADNVKPIKKVVVKFEENKPDWSVDVKLGYYQNTVPSEIGLVEKKDQSFVNDVVYANENGVSMTNLLITVDNAKNAGAAAQFWPAIAEIEIYVDEEKSESEYVNLAQNAVITSVGGSYGNPSSLVDDNYSTLYGFYGGGMSSLNGKECFIQMDLKDDYEINSLEVAFEKKDTDSNGFVFHYSLYGMTKAASEWTPIVKDATATRVDNIKEHLLDANGGTVTYSKIKFVLDRVESTGGDPWPAVAEFKVFGIGKTVEDNDNIAWKKPVHTNTSQTNGSKITDGNLTTSWSGTYYPGYADINLEENYNIDEIEVYLPTSGYTQYDIYTSLDGRDFTKLYSKTSTDSTPDNGDIIKAEGTEARIVRVYVNYQSAGSNAIINEVRMSGTKSSTAVQETPAVEVSNFEDSEYNVEVTPEMALEEVQGIVKRQLGAPYVNWFNFSLAENPNGSGYDYYQLSEGENGKINILGNDGVSLATGLNYYLKYYLNVNISQVGNQVNMPATSVSLNGKTIFKETKMAIRYAYNYCTLSYAMAFWGEEEWRNELDWLALNGVNMVLDATAQEEVWRRFLSEVGYTPQEAKDFISGPAYYAWSYMANMSGYGGPVHDSWFADRTELARENQLTMRKLGMQPILQGYSGMVPIDIESKDTETKGNIISQGTWCSFTRPSMLKTNSNVFKKYADLFYDVQKEVYGDVSDFYATDPFHEGGNSGGLDMSDVGRIVLDEMMKADADATWIIQSWGSNPSSALLNGIAANKDHALILDLYAEKEPRWETWAGGEFADTPWIYCMLNNFGGRLGLHGHIENFVNAIPKAINNAENMKGIGITPEASVNNPILYDLFFETIWSDDADNVKAIDLDTWFKDYTTRRYGGESDSAYQAMQILNDTVYNPGLNMKGQGAPESIINARPEYDISAASTWGNAIVDYKKEDLEKAAKLLLEDFDKLKDSEGYQYDLANVLEQVLSNSAQEYQKAMTRAYQSNDLDQFKALSDKFLSLINMVENVTGTQEKFLVGTWIEQAKNLASNADEFTKELYEFNARSLVSTWGSINQANLGGLKDYSNRQWAGLTKDYYKPRWERWINERIKDLEGTGGKNISSSEWFAMEWQWVNSNNEYTTESNGLDLSELGENILTNYTVSSIPKDPSEDDSKDLPVNGMKITSGSEQSTTGSEGPASNLFDGNTSTIWHSLWAGTDRNNLWVDVDLGSEQEIDGLRFLPRQSGSNGVITEYKIEVKNSDGKYSVVAEGTWSTSTAWKVVTFDKPVMATNVRLSAVNSLTDSANKNYAAGAELRITHPVSDVVSKAALQTLYDETKNTKQGSYTNDSWKVFKDALESAKAVLENEVATQADVNTATETLQNAFVNLVEDTTVLKGILKNTIDKANGADLSKLAPNVKAMIETRTKEAEAVYNDVKASNNMCMEAWLNLANALQYLDFIADKADLKAFITECENINTSEYIAGVEEFEAALKVAQDVAANDNVLQDTINTAYQNLMKAKDGLIKANVDKSLLQSVVTSITTAIGDGSKYKHDNAWDSFQTALTVANHVLQNATATQEEINSALSTLTSAYTDIRLMPDEALLAQLQDFTNAIDKADLSLYHADDVAKILKARSAVAAMLADPENITAGAYAAIQTEMAEVLYILEHGKIAVPEVPTDSAKPDDTSTPSTVEKPDPTTTGTAKPGTTKTGDTTNMLGLSALLMVSAGAVITLRKKQKKNK